MSYDPRMNEFGAVLAELCDQTADLIDWRSNDHSTNGEARAGMRAKARQLSHIAESLRRVVPNAGELIEKSSRTEG